ncbi:N-acetylmuramoyl-L-alanine amidase [Actinoplanes sp. NPDC051861]|uniref:N-acetylmuramoyl-L-alanine amidase n=1 Tax=Actinoplanes sp. NPDC051861 TaxID=3155170 RepID=UPI003430EDEC
MHSNGGNQVRRRAVIGALGAGAATALAGARPAVAAPPGGDGRTFPRTLAARGTTGTARPGFAVQTVGVRWPAHARTARLRFAGRDGRWGGWRTVAEGCPAGAGDDGPATERLALMTAPGSPAYQLDLPAGARAVALNATDGPALPGTPTVGGDRTRLAGRVFLTRSAWGADESLRFDAAGAERYPATYWPVQTFTVHHTATANDDPDPAARMRSVYRYQAVELGYGDFGYHFLIDEAGRVYEGRWSGGDMVPGFDPAGYMVNASHVGGYNAGNVGVVLLGDFVQREPTPAARTSLTLLLAALAGWCRVDPLATVGYVNPISGLRRTVPAIALHRDWAATECPGGTLAALMPGIRTQVAAVLADPHRAALFAG